LLYQSNFSLARFILNIHERLFGEALKRRFEVAIIYLAIGGFLAHLALIYLHNADVLFPDTPTGRLLEDPISAIYTPFSFILVFEVYQLIYHLPRSFTTSIATQYEIISLIVIRRIFKDISNLELQNFWSHKYDRLFVGDMVGFVLLFLLIYFFHRLRASKPSFPDPPGLERFIQFKKGISVLLLPLLIGLAVYSLGEWVLEIRQFTAGDIKELTDINNIFYDEFFTALILIDVLILLVSLLYTEHYSQLIRNAGFIISTVMIRLSFSAEGLINIALIVGGALFGVLIHWIYNRIGNLNKEAAISEV